MTPERSHRSPDVTPSNTTSGPPAHGTIAINAAYLAHLMKPENLNITSSELARATGVSSGYVRQVRTGRRPRVSRAFLRAAEIYIGDRIGWRDVPTGVLLAKNQGD